MTKEWTLQQYGTFNIWRQDDIPFRNYHEAWFPSSASPLKHWRHKQVANHVILVNRQPVHNMHSRWLIYGVLKKVCTEMRVITSGTSVLQHRLIGRCLCLRQANITTITSTSYHPHFSAAAFKVTAVRRTAKPNTSLLLFSQHPQSVTALRHIREDHQIKKQKLSAAKRCQK